MSRFGLAVRSFAGLLNGRRRFDSPHQFSSSSKVVTEGEAGVWPAPGRDGGQSAGAERKSRWSSWAVVPNRLYVCNVRTVFCDVATHI